MLDFTKLWNKIYLFGPYPPSFSRSDKIFFVAAVFFVLLGIIAKIIVLRADRQSPARYLYNRYFHLFLTMGISLLLWAGARYENIPWIETHFFGLGLYLLWLVWFAFIARYWFRDFRPLNRSWQNELVKRKYLEKK